MGAAVATLTLTLSTSPGALVDDGAMWDPKTQTYVGGVVPSRHPAASINDLLAENGGRLRIFGYGSLCWHPVLSLAGKEGDGRVTTAPGRAVGYCAAGRRGRPTTAADRRPTGSSARSSATARSEGSKAAASVRRKLARNVP